MFYYKLVSLSVSGKTRLACRVYVVEAETGVVAIEKIRSLLRAENYEGVLSLHDADDLPSGPYTSWAEANIAAFAEIKIIRDAVKISA